MLGRIDIDLFRFINTTLTNPVFDLLMPIVTKLGAPVTMNIVAIALLFFKDAKKRMAAILIFAGLTATYYVVDLLKNFAMMPRPFTSMPDAHLLVPLPDGFSFPSRHATQAFMAAAVLSGFYKRHALWFALAALVAFSKVYVGVHYVSDASAGGACGTAIGYALVKMVRAIPVRANYN